MADILLSFGVATGKADVSEIQKGLQTIIKKIEESPPKVRVGLTVDQEALKNFKSQLEKILNTVSLANGSPINLNISGLGEISVQANKAAVSISKVSAEMKEAGQAGTISSTQIKNALTQAGKLLSTNKSGYSGLESYKKLKELFGQIDPIIGKINADGSDLFDKFSVAGLDATKVVEQLKNAMSDLKYEVSTTKANDKISEAERQIRSLDTAIKQYESYLKKWSAAKHGKTSGDYDAMVKEIEAFKEMRSNIASTGNAVDGFKDKYSESISILQNHATVIKDAGEDTQSLGDKIGGLAGKFSSWLTISQTIMAVIRAVKQMVAIVMELDTAMTELKKVTDETDATYERFLNNAVTRAKRMGATLSDVVTATADFARLGFGIDDASKLADAAIIYKNVGDGIDSISQASESIISTMQAFGIEASDVMSIVDKFNEVGNNFAISSTGIGDAMQRSAAAMKAANNTIDETIALITAANTIVQNPESVGTTLKTVSMYLRAAKTEAEEAGESTEGMAGSVSELRDEILQLTGQRVDIQLDEDSFKSTYQILKELSQVWDNLTDTSRANITEMIGGKRNANVISSLLENFTIAEKALQTSSNAAGSALAENEKYLDSIAGRISKFQTSWQALSATVVNSDWIKAAVDSATGLVDAINWVCEAAGGLGAALVSIPAIWKPVANILSSIGDKAKSLVGGAKRRPSEYAHHTVMVTWNERIYHP